MSQRWAKKPAMSGAMEPATSQEPTRGLGTSKKPGRQQEASMGQGESHGVSNEPGSHKELGSQQ